MSNLLPLNPCPFLIETHILHSSKQSRSSKVEHLSHQDLWLAMTVTAHKTRATGQNDGYTILVRGDQTANLKLVGVEENGQKTGVNDHTTIEDPIEDKEDIVMGEEGDTDEVEAQEQQQQQVPQSSQMKPKIGFHRYIAAEYIDT